MSQAPPSLHSLIARAARLRAGGSPWELIGQQVHRSERSVRRWPHLFPVEWDKHYRLAEEQNLADAANEALLFLRKQFRDEDGRTSTTSSKFVLGKRREAILWQEKRSASSRAPDSSLAALVPQLEAMTDEELRAFVLDFAAKRMEREGAGVLPDGCEGSPAQPR